MYQSECQQGIRPQALGEFLQCTRGPARSLLSLCAPCPGLAMNLSGASPEPLSVAGAITSGHMSRGLTLSHLGSGLHTDRAQAESRYWRERAGDSSLSTAPPPDCTQPTTAFFTLHSGLEFLQSKFMSWLTKTKKWNVSDKLIKWSGYTSFLTM